MAGKFQDIRIPKRKTHTSSKKVVLKSSASEKPLKESGSIKKPRWSSIKSKMPERDYSNFNGKRFVLWSIVVLASLFLIFSFTGLFAGATIKITPKQEKSIIDGVFSLSQEDGDGNLQFEVMILAGDKSMDIKTTEERQVDRKASGEIVVYNAHDSLVQRLIKNTRFETPDGKIYRIKDSIVVPGTTIEEGTIVPGSVSVIIYADEPGKEYNKGFSDFTIPGFKGGPRYENFYARSKTEIINGFSGVVNFPSEAAVLGAREILASELRESLIEQVNIQKPEGFVLYEDGIFITHDDNEDVSTASGNTVTVTERATLYGVILKEDVLAKFIAKQALATFDDEEVNVLNIKDLSFKIVNKENSSPLSGDLSVSIVGDVHVVWEIDDLALSQALVGAPKKQFQDILLDFPYIQRAEATLRPFWKRTLPEQAKNIKIEKIVE